MDKTNRMVQINPGLTLMNSEKQRKTLLYERNNKLKKGFNSG